MSNQIRLFVAIELPKAVKQEIARIQAVLKAVHCFEAKYVIPEQAHITMKFIGSVDADQVDTIVKTLGLIAFEASFARLGGVGVFCADDKVKIIYMNVIAPPLLALATDLDEQLLPWCQPEKREFVSHVTLARVKHVANRQRFDEVLNALIVEPITFEIDSFVLIQSVLTQTGPEYKIIATFK